MNALTYFFFNLGLLNILLALTAFLLGLLLGWLLWGKLKNEINSYINRQKKDKAEIDSLRSKNQSISAKLANVGAAGAGDDSLKAEYDQCKATRLKLEADQKSDRETIADLRSKLAECEKNKANECSADEGESPELKSQGASQSFAASAAAIPAVAPASTPSATSVNTGGNTASRDFFKEDLASGKMTEDDKYGLLYNSAPNEVDDLTKIKGVAGVLNKTLNDYGVFTYRQIAIWSPQICEDFSERISFKGRIERDDWISQCKAFHKEKYGETI